MATPTRLTQAGIGDPGPDGRFINRLGVGWYYNWRPIASLDVSMAEFVPMIWGREDTTDETLARVVHSNRSGHLLGFNEPERRDQSNLTVAEAIQAWPRLMQTGFRLGSPAISLDRRGKAWLREFLGAVGTGLRVDFICVHWYGDLIRPDAAETLRAELGAIHQAYGQPVWLTEFGAMDAYFSAGQNGPLLAAEFIQRTRPMLESLSFLERAAWFSASPVEGYLASALFDPAGEWTAAGEAYRVPIPAGV